MTQGQDVSQEYMGPSISYNGAIYVLQWGHLRAPDVKEEERSGARKLKF